jgi:hypothetical protein
LAAEEAARLVRCFQRYLRLEKEEYDQLKTNTAATIEFDAADFDWLLITRLINY